MSPLSKKVAILTWFHYRNYGTALQVTALYNIIKSLGHCVDVIDYIPNRKSHSQQIRLLSTIKKCLKSVTRFARVKKKNRPIYVIDTVRDNKYEAFLKSQLSFTCQCVTSDNFKILNEQYDAFVCGSDQIWAPSLFDSHYFLDFVINDAKKIAYAPSMGLTMIEDKYVKETMGMLVSSFAHLSVREKQAADIISDLWYKNAEVVLDPTLLLTYDQWRTIIPTITSSKKYILCYFLGENDNAWKHAAAISRSLNLPLVIVPIFAKDKNKGECAYGTGPVEFFNLIDNAAFVCTDSFHGTIFSIICGKPFYVFERFHREDNRSQNSRVYHLLDITCFDNRLIHYDESLKSHYEFTCDITDAAQCLATEREVSLNFLKGALNHG